MGSPAVDAMASAAQEATAMGLAMSATSGDRMLASSSLFQFGQTDGIACGHPAAGGVLKRIKDSRKGKGRSWKLKKSKSR